MCLRASSVSAERVGQGEVGGVICRVLCTWWLLGLALKRPWLVPDCMGRLRKHYSYLAEGWFLARKAAWALSGCMATDSSDYYMLVNGVGVVKVTRLLIKARSGHGCSFGVRAWTEMEIRWVKGMCGLKVV